MYRSPFLKSNSARRISQKETIQCCASSPYTLFHRIPSTNAESEHQGGGGVSPPGVFDIILY